MRKIIETTIGTLQSTVKKGKQSITKVSIAITTKALHTRHCEFAWFNSCCCYLVSSQDYVTVYDGYTTRDPVILKFCGGGQPLPPSISSGPELLVEFTTSPYGTFTKPHPNNINSLNGFQLEVSTIFIVVLFICIGFSSLCLHPSLLWPSLLS